MYLLQYPGLRERNRKQELLSHNIIPLTNNMPTKIHYGWVITFTGMAVIFGCLGLGRFALGMVLPAMGKSLELSYSQMGYISTGNFIGYMFAVSIAGFVAKRFGPRVTISWGLVIVAITMCLVGCSRGFWHILPLYVTTGIGSGLSNVPLMGLISRWFLKDSRGRAAGIMVSGNGLAFFSAGLFVPLMNISLGEDGWRYSWGTMGVIVLAIAATAGLLLRNSPEEKSTSAFGRNRETVDLSSPEISSKKLKLTLIHLGVIYLLYAATQVVYATFIVTTLVDQHGFSEQAAGRFWAALGALSIFTGPFFGWISDRLGRRTALLIVFSLFTLAYGLVGMDVSMAGLYLSIVFFGLAVWSVPTIMAAAVGDYAGPMHAAGAFGFITLFFGMGQITGPALAGYFADVTGSFQLSFAACAAGTAIAFFLTLLLPTAGKN